METGKQLMNSLLLAVPDPLQVFWKTSTWWLVLGLSVCVLISLILWIKSNWIEHDDPASLDHEMLSQIAELQRRGELTNEEFRSIKGRLASRLKDSTLSKDPPSPVAEEQSQ